MNYVMQAVVEIMASTVEIQWLEHLWNHENMFDTGVVRAI